MSPNQVVLSITGMTCDGCVGAVTRVLSRVPGVAEAKVDLAVGRATVIGNVAPEALVAAVAAAGYGAAIP
jgi:copper chaperone CopZ